MTELHGKFKFCPGSNFKYSKSNSCSPTSSKPPYFQLYFLYFNYSKPLKY